MDDGGLRRWLGQRFSPKTVSSRLSEIKRIELAYGSLQGHFEADGMRRVIASLEYSAEDDRRGLANPSLIPISETASLLGNLASYRAAAQLYKAYMEDPAAVQDLILDEVTVGITPTGNSTFGHLSARELLVLQADALAELRKRNIVRTNNAPAGDYAELLFATAFGWTLAGNSSTGFDATDKAGTRFQIKCRRLAKESGSRQLSAIRRLQTKPFDTLAAVLFTEDFRVYRGAHIPFEIVQSIAIFMPHVNAHRFLLTDSIWSMAGVEDVTLALKVAEDAVAAFELPSSEE